MSVIIYYISNWRLMGCNRKSYPGEETAPRLLTPFSVQDWAHLPGLSRTDQHPLGAEYQPGGERTAHALRRGVPAKQRPQGKVKATLLRIREKKHKMRDEHPGSYQIPSNLAKWKCKLREFSMRGVTPTWTVPPI